MVSGPPHSGVTRASDSSDLESSDGSPYPPCVTEQVPGGGSQCGAFEMVYDATDGYVVAYSICVEPRVVFTSCTWKYSGGTWTNITSPTGPNPPADLGESFVWDAPDRCAVLFGGLIYPIGDPLRTVWEFRGGAWTNLTSVVSPAIPGTWSTRATYDSSDGYVVSVWQNFIRPSGATYSYTYHGGLWTNVTATSNESGFPLQPVAADDPSDGGALFFGGANGSTLASTNETWLFSGGMWHLLAGRPAPSSRDSPSMAYDSLDGYVLMVGGTVGICGNPGCELLPDEWTFAHGRWTNVTSTVRGDPPVEQGGLMVTDLADGYLLEGFGIVGVYNSTGFEIPQSGLYTYLNGTWTAYFPPTAAGFPWLEAYSLTLVAVVAAAAATAYLLRFQRRRRGSPAQPLTEGTR